MHRRLEGTRLRAPAAAFAVAFSALVPAPARGVPAPPRTPTSHGHTVFQSRHLWATIDVCNTPKQHHIVGVRGSMPGSGLGNELMYMRFRLQYRNSAGGWTYVGPTADSGFVLVGSSTYKARQAGRNFTIDPAPGSHVVARGVVTFEWRRRDHVVRNAQKVTSPGHRSIAGADPPNYSAAACEL